MSGVLRAFLENMATTGGPAGTFLQSMQNAQRHADNARALAEKKRQFDTSMPLRQEKLAQGMQSEDLKRQNLGLGKDRFAETQTQNSWKRSPDRLVDSALRSSFPQLDPTAKAGLDLGTPQLALSGLAKPFQETSQRKVALENSKAQVRQNQSTGGFKDRLDYKLDNSPPTPNSPGEQERRLLLKRREDIMKAQRGIPGLLAKRQLLQSQVPVLQKQYADQLADVEGKIKSSTPAPRERPMGSRPGDVIPPGTLFDPDSGRFMEPPHFRTAPAPDMGALSPQAREAAAATPPPAQSPQAVDPAVASDPGDMGYGTMNSVIGEWRKRNPNPTAEQKKTFRDKLLSLGFKL